MSNAYIIYFSILAIVVSLLVLSSLYGIFLSKEGRGASLDMLISGTPYRLIKPLRILSAVSEIVGIIGFFVPFIVFPHLLCIDEKTIAWSYFAFYLVFVIILHKPLSNLFLIINIGTNSALSVVISGLVVLISFVFAVFYFAHQTLHPILILASWEISRELYHSILETGDDFLNTPIAYLQNKALQARTKLFASLFIIVSFIPCFGYFAIEILK